MKQLVTLKKIGVSQFGFMTIIWHTTGVQSCFIFFINPVCYFLLQILNMISKLLESPLIPVAKVGDETESSTSKVTIRASENFLFPADGNFLL